MKKFLLIICLLLNFSSFSQSIEFEKITEIDSIVAKEILFNRLSSRLYEYFDGQNNYEKNIIQSDKDLGVIKFRQVIRYDPGKARSDIGYVYFNVNVYFKDGKFRIIFSDFVHEAPISYYEITEDEEYPHEKRDWLKFRKKGWVKLKEYLEIEMPKKFPIYETMILIPIEQEKDW
tara:strand:- start:48 stop:572 length:525 start_codon:yes stop_codon:yes gene_type:complete